MPDTGAHDGLCGGVWARKQATEALAAGHECHQDKMQVPRRVAGVGQGSQQAEFEVILPAAMVDTDGVAYVEKFKAPCIEGGLH